MGIGQFNRTGQRARGPGGSFSAFEALAAGTGVEIIGKNDKETWLLVRLDDGREGWVFGQLVRIQPSPTPFPTMTPSPDLTRLFLGTPLPTALIGGGTITPTPPRSVVTPTDVTELPTTLTPTATSDTSGIPVIDVDSINLTATALVSGISMATPTPTQAAHSDPRSRRNSRASIGDAADRHPQRHGHSPRERPCLCPVR